MTNSYVGIDSSTFYHHGPKSFKAPFGVAVEVEDFEKFNDSYIGIMESIKKTFGLSSPRICVKGHFIHQKIGDNGARWFINSFIDKIIPHLKLIYVAHLVISPTKVPEVMTSRGAKIPTMNFIDSVASSYNHIILWNYLDRFPEKTNSYFFVDHFTGTTTKAWEDVEDLENLFILSDGEYCNSLISTADLFCKFINDSIFTNHKRLGFDGISDTFSGKPIVEIHEPVDPTIVEDPSNAHKVKLYQTNNSPFSIIIPTSGRRIEVDAKLKHPVIYILTSKKLKNEISVIENTPIYDRLVNEAFSTQGCVRGINIDELENEIKYMKEGDKIITFGDSAYEKATYLANDLGIPIEITTSKELLKN
jgi:hypothetical protein